jgi:hypothetical protein
LPKNFTQKLSRLRPGPGASRSGRTCVPTNIALAQFVLHVAASNVNGKGFDQVIGKAFAPKLQSTHRAARISPLENTDSQRSLAFQHAEIVPQNSLFVYVNVLPHPLARDGGDRGGDLAGILDLSTRGHFVFHKRS